MEPETAQTLLDFYRHQLLDDIMPFWVEHSPDVEFGGYFTCLDRAGSVIRPDKYLWLQGRGVWIFSALYHRLEARTDWLELAELGVQFLKKHGPDEQGRWPFHLTREGRVVEGPISIYSDFFVVYGLAEYSRAAGDEEALMLARETYRSILGRIQDPRYRGFFPFPESRAFSRHTLWMIMLEITQELGVISPHPKDRDIIDECLRAILDKHVRPSKKAVVENLTSDFQSLNTPQGRLINPGHGLESAWFVMHQGRRSGASELIERAAQMVEWSYLRGWDQEMGGLYAFVDLSGAPPDPQEWFQQEGVVWTEKVWWAHAEALYALLLAHDLTGDQRFLDWHHQLHRWTFAHFVDDEFGEWFPYLYRDGKPKVTDKGSPWKGPFHVARALLLCIKELEDIERDFQGAVEV